MLTPIYLLRGTSSPDPLTRRSASMLVAGVLLFSALPSIAYAQAVSALTTARQSSCADIVVSLRQRVPASAEEVGRVFLCKGDRRVAAALLWERLPSDPSIMAQLEHGSVQNLDALLLESIARVAEAATDRIRRQAALHVLFRSVDPSITVKVRATPDSLEYTLQTLTHSSDTVVQSLKPRALAILQKLSVDAEHTDVRGASREYLAWFNRSRKP